MRTADQQINGKIEKRNQNEKSLDRWFLSLIGSIWTLTLMYVVGNNLVSGWFNPPGRLLTTVSEMGLTFPLVLSILCTILGIAIMGVEFFKHDK